MEERRRCLRMNPDANLLTLLHVKSKQDWVV